MASHSTRYQKGCWILILLTFSLAFTACIFEPIDLSGLYLPERKKPGPGDPPELDPVHEHQWGAWSVTAAATCSATGLETRTCELDPSHTETQTIAIDPNAHVPGSNSTITKAATCTEDGIASGTCALNPSHILNNSVIQALGHDYGNWQQTTAPTCTTAGVDTRTCSRNDSTITRAVAINPNAHDWNTSYTTISAVTETTDGIEAITCKHNASHTKDGIIAYATGTAGLAFEAIDSTAYRLRAGTVTIGAVHIPAYHRPNANSPYLPVTEMGSDSDTYSSGAFNNTGITAVTFASNSQLKTISTWAFYNCAGLTGITIPAGVTSIGSEAFYGWTSSQTINIQDKANQAAADAAWGADWRNGCNAVINYGQ